MVSTFSKGCDLSTQRERPRSGERKSENAKAPGPKRSASSREGAAPRSLFPQLGAESMRLLEQLPAALEQVMPLKRRHREDLPAAVRDLSKLLTSERGGLSGGYLQTPRTLAAYAHYFLPWNIYRQARLFSGQWLRLPHKAVILDLGSGPLTTVLALWTARPDLRDKVMSFICVDHSRKAPSASWARTCFAPSGEPGGCSWWTAPWRSTCAMRTLPTA